MGRRERERRIRLHADEELPIRIIRSRTRLGAELREAVRILGIDTTIGIANDVLQTMEPVVVFEDISPREE